MLQQFHEYVHPGSLRTFCSLRP